MHSASHVIDLSDRKELTYAILEHVFGPLVWHNEQWAEGRIDERPIWIERSYVEGRHEKYFNLAAPVGRPVELGIHLRSNTAQVRQEVPVGDRVFAAEYIVAGTPTEVIRAALDDNVRAWLRAHWPGEAPPLSVGFDGFLKMCRYMPSSHELQSGSARPIRPEDIASCARGIQRLAVSLTEQFDAAYATIARTQGPGAAATWAKSYQDARQTESARQERIKRWFLYGVIGFVALTLLLSLAFALVMVSLS
jgi:hypothetical protein